MRMVVSASRLFLWQACILLRRCALISGKSGMRFHYIKEDVGLRVTDRITKNFEDASLDMVTVLLWAQQFFPDSME